MSLGVTCLFLNDQNDVSGRTKVLWRPRFSFSKVIDEAFKKRGQE